MYSDALTAKLNEIANEYRDYFHRSIHDVLSREKFVNTGAGLASLQVEVITGTKTKSPVITVTLDNHVMLMEKRSMQWTKLPRVSSLMEWADTIKSEPKEARRLAWSVAWQKKRTNKWKRKSWRRTSLAPVLKRLNLELKLAFQEAIEQEANRQLEQAYNQTL